MKKRFKLCVLILSLAVLFLTACAAENTSLVFSFRSNSSSDFKEEKTLYFNEAREKVVLDASLQIDDGNVSVRVYDTDNEIVWNNTYEKSESFEIELYNVASDEEYKLEVSANQTKSAELKIFSEENLVKDKEKPEKPIIDLCKGAFTL